MAKNKETVEIGIDVKGVDNVNDATTAINSLNDSASDAKGALSDIGADTSVFDDIKNKVTGAISGVKGFARSFSTVKGAIAATGIGALLIAVTSLVAYFKNTEKGAKTLRIATEALGIIMNEVSDVFVTLGTSIIETFSNPKQSILDFVEFIKDNITNRIIGLIELFPKLGEAISLTFSGKFKEAGKVAIDAVAKVTLGVEDITDKAVKLGEQAKETFNTIVEETKKAVVQATAYINAQDNLRNSINRLTIANAKLNEESELQKQIGEDTTLTYEKRKIALDKAGVAQLQLAENVAKQAALEESLLRLQISNTRNVEERKELENQLSEQIATRIEAETAISLERADIAKVDRELYQEEVDRVESLSNLIRESNIDNTKSKYAALQAQLNLDENAALLEATRLKATETQKQNIRIGFTNQRIDLENERIAEIEDAEKTAKENEENLLRESIEYKKQITRDFERNKLDGLDLAIFDAQNRYDDDVENYRKALAEKKISQADFDAISIGRKKEFDTQIGAINVASEEVAEEARKAKNSERLQQTNAAISVAGDIADAISKIAQDANDKELAKQIDLSNSKIDEKRKELADGKINQDEFDKFKLESEKELADKTELLAKKAFENNKKSSIAAAAISTVQGAISAFTSLSAIPVVGVPLGIAAATAATAVGLSNISKIKATTFQSSGDVSGGGDSGFSGDLSAGLSGNTNNDAPVPPTVSLFGNEMDSVNQSGLNQSNGERQQDLRVYVVESDITGTQNTLNTYKVRSEIG